MINSSYGAGAEVVEKLAPDALAFSHNHTVGVGLCLAGERADMNANTTKDFFAR